MKRISLRIHVWGASLLAIGAVHAADPGVKLNPKAGEDSASPLTDVPEIRIPPNTVIPEDTKELVEAFQAQAQQFIVQQRELWKQTKGASVEERRKLLELLRSSRQNFLDQTRDIRADIKDRIKDLKDTIKESRPQAAGAGESGGRRRHGGD